ncbi:PAK-2p27 [Orbilia brochopaga]|nr:PAK-2p27 [Drechslerella brochopaga]
MASRRCSVKHKHSRTDSALLKGGGKQALEESISEGTDNGTVDDQEDEEVEESEGAESSDDNDVAVIPAPENHEDSDDNRSGGSWDDQAYPSEDQYSDESDGTVEDICPETQVEIDQFMKTFRKLDLHFKIIGKTGEGTFSSVYKAIDLRYDKYVNDWDLEERTAEYHSPRSKRQRLSHGKERRPKYVAIKKIYVTSSPQRIHNELELLKDLSGSKNVVSLITAFRHMDQVIAVMPYFRHVDFRDYFRKLEIPEIQLYMRSLFTALKFVHAKGILHRDIKPTNFLYDCSKGRGVLVDFGLAERESDDGTCTCLNAAEINRRDLKSYNLQLGGYPKNDQRPSKRANRAGTRGFRAPEVLFKCNAQTTKIDIWSAGVILLTFLSKRFPFFNSPDDIDAIIEMATVFGRAKMRVCAALHADLQYQGATFETVIPTITEKGHSLGRIVEWATARSRDNPLTLEEKTALQFLEATLELNYQRRLSADQALLHPFLTDIVPDVSDDEVETI